MDNIKKDIKEFLEGILPRKYFLTVKDILEIGFVQTAGCLHKLRHKGGGPPCFLFSPRTILYPRRKFVEWCSEQNFGGQW